MKRLFIALNAIVFLSFGPAFWFGAHRFASWLDLDATSASGWADLRAMYGGLTFGVGLLFARALWNRTFEGPAMFVILSTTLGLALSRMWSMAVEPGAVEWHIWAFLVLEWSGIATAVWLERPPSPLPPPAPVGASQG